VTGTALAERLASVRAGVADAARAAGRSPEELTTIVVTKFHPADLVRELLDLGVTEFGENRHQEASAKAADLAGTAARWHFIGQLQSKKARAALEYASVIHSLDRESVVAALAGQGTVDGFIQINLTDDPGRGGVAARDLEHLTETVLAAPGITLRGVMAVAPLDEEPAAAFARLRTLSERVRTLAPQATWISAGMSHDYAAAIREGATHLRIGSAITGNRPAPR
jgi:pyridoxal phosphate enzyme (YggS family)